MNHMKKTLTGLLTLAMALAILMPAALAAELTDGIGVAGTVLPTQNYR